MDRRTFLSSTAAVLVSATMIPLLRAADKSRPNILLRSSWQTVNIGDIGHTPGVLALLETYLPEAQVRLWPSNVGDGVSDMLQRRFPKLEIIQKSDIAAAMRDADFLLHGSGPSLVAAKDLARWRQETGKPYGVDGITFSSKDPTVIDLLNNARFVYFRDSVSLDFAKKAGVKSPVTEFGPDGAFAIDLKNDEAALSFMAANKLEQGKFLCCIPRLRNTPYWKIRNQPMTDKDKRSHETNEKMKEHDHAPLREAIIAVARQTNLKILVCPEDRSQMAVGKEMLVDPLPEDVKSRVVWRENYWLTDEALSTYRRSAGLFGNEMHSPIMCIGNGIPAIVCRWAQQTSKGYMWRDIGLGEWLFNMDEESEIPGIAPAVLAMAKDPQNAKAKAIKARAFVQQHQKEMMATLRKALDLNLKV